MSRLKVLSWNILAPSWAHPTLYPKGARLARDQRLQSWLTVISSVAADVICLQEVNEKEFGHLCSALHEYQGNIAYHSPQYWSEWIKDDLPWEPNGNAIFVLKQKFKVLQFYDFHLGLDGNHAALVQVRQCIDGLPKEGDDMAHNPSASCANDLWISSIHLDTLNEAKRESELKSLMENIDGLIANDTRDIIICGDFNTSILSAGDTLRSLLSERRMKNTMKMERLTRPISTGKYGAIPNQGIDHILHRNGYCTEAAVIDLDAGTLFPATDDGNEDLRINDALGRLGSDHYPVVATIEYSATEL